MLHVSRDTKPTNVENHTHVTNATEGTNTLRHYVNTKFSNVGRILNFAASLKHANLKQSSREI